MILQSPGKVGFIDRGIGPRVDFGCSGSGFGEKIIVIRIVGVIVIVITEKLIRI